MPSASRRRSASGSRLTMGRLPLFVAVLAISGCATKGGGTPVGPEDPAALAREEKEGFPAPETLEEGDRWYVAVRPADARGPFAMRNRRARSGGFVREEVV